MDEFLKQEFYTPMGLKRTGYLPLRFLSKEGNCAPLRWPLHGKTVLQICTRWIGRFSRRCFRQCGLFSTAEEVAQIYQMLNGGELNGKRYLKQETCRLFTTTVAKGCRRGLGFDKPDVQNHEKSCALSAPASVYGHTGFTGTCAWVDLITVFGLCIPQQSYLSGGGIRNC